MSKKKDKRKNKKNKTNTKNNEAYLRRESINVGQLNTQKNSTSTVLWAR